MPWVILNWTSILQEEVKKKHLLLNNPLTPVPPVTTRDLSSSPDIITFDQTWHHLYSTSAGEKDLFNGA